VKSFDHLDVDGCVVKLARWHVKEEDIHKVVQNAMARHNKHVFTPPFPHLYPLLVKTHFQSKYYCVDCGLSLKESVDH
jgi:predicted metal-dependent hydrolase